MLNAVPPATKPPDSKAQELKMLATIAMAAIIAGSIARLWVVALRGSLWLDEASLALNILPRSFGALWAPLDWGQAAPPGFLWIEKAVTMALGSGELALRVWPFIAGTAVVPLAWLVGRRAVGEGGAALATVALAFSLIAIRYSSEVKPYGSDAAVALALTWLALEVHRAPDNLRRWAALGVGGVVGMVLSLPAMFILAGAVVALYRSAWNGESNSRAALAACAGAWGVTFVVLWVALLHVSAGDSYLREYWAPVMLDPAAPDLPARLLRAAASVAATPLRWTGSIGVAAVAIVTTICGVGVAWRRDRAFALMLAAPPVLAAGASMIGAYPMSDRLAFFSAPASLLCSGACVAGLIGALVRKKPSAAGGAFVVAAAALTAWVGSDALRMLRAPGSLEPTHELFASVHTEAVRSGEPVYVFARATPAWVYVTTDWRSPAADRLATYRAYAGLTDARGHENYARASSVTPNAGEPLVWRASDGAPPELIGLATGVRYRIAGPMSRDVPSDGWAEEEARRIRDALEPPERAAGSPQNPVVPRARAAWLVASHFFEGTPRDELRPLVEALRAAGVQVVDERRAGRDAVALRLALAR